MFKIKRNPVSIFLCVATAQCISSKVTADEIPKIWVQVYQELNPADESFSDSLWTRNRDEWARREEKRLEPILLSILRGERTGVEWSRALPIARVLTTDAVKQVLWNRLMESVAQVGDGCFKSSSAEEGSFTYIVSILSRAGDKRVTSIAADFANRECQSALVVERCVEAIERVGNNQSVALIVSIPHRKRYEHIERLCARAEKTIAERESGHDVLADANEKLQSLTMRFLHALETGDSKAYIDVHAFGFRKLADEVKIKKDVFENAELDDMIQSLKQVAGREVFEVDRDKFEARLLVEGRYKITYVFEVEGWKIAGVERVAP